MKKSITVSQLTNYIKHEILSDIYLQNLLVEGEIVNLTISKFTYFSLKDGDALLSCVLFNNNFNFKEGDKVIVRGSLNIYANQSKYQIKVKETSFSGEGEEFKRILELKNKLEKIGYFDKKYKTKIPNYPLNIGLITGKESAAYYDFLKILRDNSYNAHIYLINTLVQGKNASNEIIQALKKLDDKSLDLIVLTRGGGSSEDLSVFNDENIANVIFNLETPIVSAIGHEIDLSIAELTSDMYFSTPTKLAEYIVSKYNLSKTQVSSTKIMIDKNINNYLIKLNTQLNEIKYKIDLASPEKTINNVKYKLDTLKNKIYNSVYSKFNYKERVILELNKKIESKINSKIRESSVYIKNENNRRIELKDVKINNYYYLFNNKLKYKIFVESEDNA